MQPFKEHLCLQKNWQFKRIQLLLYQLMLSSQKKSIDSLTDSNKINLVYDLIETSESFLMGIQ